MTPDQFIDYSARQLADGFLIGFCLCAFVWTVLSALHKILSDIIWGQPK